MATFKDRRLVVFGCGYVGGELARQAMARGARVTALTRNVDTAASLRSCGVEVVVADLASGAWHAQIGGASDWVVNTVSSGGAGLEGYRRSYLKGMRSIVAWAGQAGPIGTMVYTSSTSVYPQGGGVSIDEREPVGGGGERAQVLVETENVLREAAFASAAGWRRYFILRLAGIYGPGRHYLIDQVRGGEVAGVGEHRLNLIHRGDVCAAIWAALEAPSRMADEVFNVADDGAASKSAVVVWLAQRLGVPLPRFTGPPAGARRGLTPDRVIANAKLKMALGWAPQFTDFRSGYENVLAAEAE